MGFSEQTFYAVTCDYPGCDAMDDGGEFTYWSEREHAITNALEGDWLLEAEDGKDRLFCAGHVERVGWLSDLPEADENTDDARYIDLPDGERVVLG